MTRSATAAKQRTIQNEVAEDDAKGKPKAETAMQAGGRTYPAPPFPKQHQKKPGDEAKLSPPALYDAPFYLGSNKLLDKVAIITGGRFRNRQVGSGFVCTRRC